MPWRGAFVYEGCVNADKDVRKSAWLCWSLWECVCVCVCKDQPVAAMCLSTWRRVSRRQWKFTPSFQSKFNVPGFHPGYMSWEVAVIYEFIFDSNTEVFFFIKMPQGGVRRWLRPPWVVRVFNKYSYGGSDDMKGVKSWGWTLVVFMLMSLLIRNTYTCVEVTV